MESTFCCLRGLLYIGFDFNGQQYTDYTKVVNKIQALNTICKLLVMSLLRLTKKAYILSLYGYSDTSFIFLCTTMQHLRLIWLITALSTVGSLYVGYFGDPVNNLLAGILLDTSRGIAACDLCRYIRACTYPIFIISSIALWKKETHIIHYIWPFALIGLFFSTYKYRLEKFASGDTFGICTSPVSCSTISLEYFGFVTLSFL